MAIQRLTFGLIWRWAKTDPETMSNHQIVFLSREVCQLVVLWFGLILIGFILLAGWGLGIFVLWLVLVYILGLLAVLPVILIRANGALHELRKELGT